MDFALISWFSREARALQNPFNSSLQWYFMVLSLGSLVRLFSQCLTYSESLDILYHRSGRNLRNLIYQAVFVAEKTPSGEVESIRML